MPAPAATITLDREYRVEFDLGTLVRIETGTGRTLDALVREMLPAQDGGERGVHLSLIVRFIASCLGLGVEQLSSVLPLERTLEVFAALGEPFAEAIAQFSSASSKPNAEGGGGQHPTAADSGSSEPGPASSSG